MFSKRSFITVDYRLHVIEIRLAHHPGGVISDLRIFKQGCSDACIAERPDSLYLDENGASKAITGRALALIDQLLLTGRPVER